MQIALTPIDYPCVRHTLPHQLRQLAASVDEVLLTFDLRRSTVGYSQLWEDRRPLMRDLLHDCRARCRNVRLVEVDYSPDIDAEIGRQFLGRQPVPHADAQGGPFYATLYGIHEANNDAILHLDGDVMVGGASPESWFARALELLDSRKEVVGISPLPGPPGDGDRPGDPADWWREDAFASDAFAYARFSTRAMFLQRSHFKSRLGPLALRLAAPLHVLSGWSAGHPPYRELNVSVNHAMTQRGLLRLALLGPKPGLWTLTPGPRKTPELVRQLPAIVRAIEANEAPPQQRGISRLNDSLDWARFGNSRPGEAH